MIARLHTYTGLLTFVNLMIFGVVGLAAALRWNAPNSAWEVRQQPLPLEPGLSDHAIAEHVVTALGLSLATPIQSAVIQHDPEGRLLLDFWHANGRHRVTVLREEGAIRVEVRRANIWKYLDTLHTTTAVFRTGDWRMRLWSWYNEFAMWSLFGMIVSGAWMWLQWHPRDRLEELETGKNPRGKLRRLHLVSGMMCLPFVLLYTVTGVSIAHRSWLAPGMLTRMHTNFPPQTAVFPMVLFSTALLSLGTSGLLLWMKNDRERRLGSAALLLGSGIATALILSMRLG